MRHVAAAVVACIGVLVFLWPSFAHNAAPGAFDLAYLSSPWRDEIDTPNGVQSPVQADQAEQIPWVAGVWRHLRDGELPQWAPEVGGGMSVGTNPVFATYSVLGLPGAPFGDGAMLISRAALGLFLAQWCTYLFLIWRGRSWGAAVLAGVAFAFCGSTLVFLSRNSLPMMIPLVMLAAEWCARGHSLRRVVGVAALTLTMWLEGFPAILVYNVALGSAWLLWRILRDTDWTHVRSAGLWTPARRGALLRAGQWGAGLALGVAASAFSILPFASQLSASGVLAARESAVYGPLGDLAAWWLIDDRALGRPAPGPWFTGLNPYEGLAAVGTIVFLLAIIGLFLPLRRSGPRDSHDARTDGAFVAVGVAVLASAIYGGGQILTLVQSIPGFAGNPFLRARVLLTFLLCMSAAAGVDLLLSPTRARLAESARLTRAGRRRRLVWAVGATVAVAALIAPLLRSWSTYRDLIGLAANSKVAEAGWRGELTGLGLVTLLITAAAVTFRRMPPRYLNLSRNLVAGVVALALFLQVGFDLTRFTPQPDRRYLFPDTLGAQRLREQLGDQFRFVGTGMSTFVGNSAMVTGLLDLRAHGFPDPEFATLMRRVDPNAWSKDPLKLNLSVHNPTADWTAPVLDDLGVRVVAMSTTEVPIGQHSPTPEPDRWLPIDPDGTDIGGPGGPLVGLDLRLRRNAACERGRIAVELVTTEAVVARATKPLRELRRNDQEPTPETLKTYVALAAAERPAEAADRIRVRIEEAAEDCRAEVGVRDTDAGPTWAGGQFRATPNSPFRVASTEGGWLLVRDAARPLVRLLDTWADIPDPSAALAAAVSPTRATTDPMPVAGGAGAPTGTGPAGTVHEWSTTGSTVSARVTAARPTVLVAAFNQGPGWTVTVDGTPAPLLQPNGALLGVAVPEGSHRVEFSYRLPGLRTGLLVSVFAALLACGLWLLDSRRGRHLASRLARPLATRLGAGRRERAAQAIRPGPGPASAAGSTHRSDAAAPD